MQTELQELVRSQGLLLPTGTDSFQSQSSGEIFGDSPQPVAPAIGGIWIDAESQQLHHQSA